MPATGIFFIPATPGAGTGTVDTLSPAQMILNSLLVRNHHLEPLSGWTLDHKLFRETPAASIGGEAVPVAGPQASANLAFFQVLVLSWQKGNAFAAISQPGQSPPAGATAPQSADATGPFPNAHANPDVRSDIVRLPAGAAGSDELVALLVTRFVPLWTRRAAWMVQNGSTFRVDETFTLRFGEVREARVGGQPALRGTVAAISVQEVPSHIAKDYVGVDTKDQESAQSERSAMLDDAQIVTRLWDKLEVPNARPFVMKYDDTEGAERDMPRLWLEALRPRS